MGNDFEARKRAKKRKATDIDPEIASEGGKKGRKKRAAVRRLCKGMCYNEPTCAHSMLTCSTSAIRPPSEYTTKFNDAANMLADNQPAVICYT